MMKAMMERELNADEVRRIRGILKFWGKVAVYAVLCILGYLAWQGSPAAQTVGLWAFIAGFMATAVHVDRYLSRR